MFISLLKHVEELPKNDFFKTGSFKDYGLARTLNTLIIRSLKLNYMKTVLFSSFLALGLGFSACNNNSTSDHTDAVDSAKTVNKEVKACYRMLQILLLMQPMEV